jgi:cytochrome c oxidase subunit 2
MRLKLLSTYCLSLFLCLGCPQAFATESNYNMPIGVTPLSHQIYTLHMLIFWICVGIGIVVFGVLFYSLFMHRKSRGYEAAKFHEHPVLEMVWAIIPFLILVAMAVPATLVLMRMEDYRDSELTIKVTGYQWKWKYEYLDQGISFFSNLATPMDEIQNKAPKSKWYLLDVDHPLVLPIQKKVRFLVTSNDVIHSWWVPELGIKRDAIPGFIHEAWALIEKPGVYRGQCAELCGVNHGFMPIVVEAKTEADFNQWVQQQNPGQATKIPILTGKNWTKSELMARGEAAYNTHCAVCHKTDGSGMPPTYPSLKGDKIVLGKPILTHINIVLNGKPGTAMQAFGNQLSDTDIAAIVTYQRNAWGNNTGDVVQPADVAAARKKNQNEVTHNG